MDPKRGQRQAKRHLSRFYRLPPRVPYTIAFFNIEIPSTFIVWNVVITYSFHNKSSILSDNVTGMEEIVRYVVEMGHRDIVYIHGAYSVVTEHRLRSFYRTMKELKIPVRDEWVCEGVYHDPESAARVTNELLTLSNRPTCIIYPDDFSCVGGLNMVLGIAIIPLIIVYLCLSKFIIRGVALGSVKG